MESKRSSSYVGNKRPLKGLKRAYCECEIYTEVHVYSSRSDTNFNIQARKGRFMEILAKRISVYTPT